jgi:hypothetical protein
MSREEIDSQLGSRICNGLGILRQCLEQAKLEEIGDRLDRLEGLEGSDRSSSDRERFADYRH